MDTPDREAKSLPHFHREVPATPLKGKHWHCVAERGKDSVTGVGDTLAEATNNCAALVAKTWPGYTL